MYIVEGNIGAGKSTFLKLLKDQIPTLEVSFEPLENWQNTDYGKSLLGLFYENPSRWAYTMETLTMMCRVKEHVRNQNNAIHANLIVERSIYSGHYCFAYNGYTQGYMTALEWDSYTTWFNFLIPNHCKAPLGFIYLKTEPAIAFERIKKRNRSSEKEITLQYLEQIHACHESFLINNKQSLPSITITPVLTLDGNEDFENNSVLLKNYIAQVQQFIRSTQQTFKPCSLDLKAIRNPEFSLDEITP